MPRENMDLSLPGGVQNQDHAVLHHGGERHGRCLCAPCRSAVLPPWHHTASPVAVLTRSGARVAVAASPAPLAPGQVQIERVPESAASAAASTASTYVSVKQATVRSRAATGQSRYLLDGLERNEGTRAQQAPASQPPPRGATNPRRIHRPQRPRLPVPMPSCPTVFSAKRAAASRP